MHLIDIWKGKEGQRNKEYVQKRFAKAIETGQIILHQDPSTAVLGQFCENHFDWVYLDTNHAFSTTAAELKTSIKVLKTNGLILGHD